MYSLRKSRCAALVRGGLATIICSILFLGLFSASASLVEVRDASCQRRLRQIAYGLFLSGDGSAPLFPIRSVAVINMSKPVECRKRMARFIPSVESPDKPEVSWRVPLLLEWQYDGILEEYDFSEAWQSPKNIALAKAMPPELGCPDDPKAMHQGTTSYAAVAGPNGNWLNSRPLPLIREHRIPQTLSWLLKSLTGRLSGLNPAT